MRPCSAWHPEPKPDECRPCWLFLHDARYNRLWGGDGKVSEGKPFVAPRPGLGDAVESALTRIGISRERVEAWLGRPCGCAERKEKLNRLGRWAARVLGR